MLFITSAYAQSAPAAASSNPITSGFMSLLPLLLMFVVLYFIMIRPQMKKQKEVKSMLASLQKDDEVITSSGVLGKIIKLNDSYIVLSIAPETEVLMQRGAIVTVLPKEGIKQALPK
jgi:preprotein translocase subunit YajC